MALSFQFIRLAFTISQTATLIGAWVKKSPVKIACAAIALMTFGARAQSNGSHESAGAVMSDSVQIKTPVEIVTQFLEAIQKGDHGTWTQLIHPNVEWVQPGNSRVSGTKMTSAEVLAMAKLMSDLSDHTMRLKEIRTVAQNGNSVACVLHWWAAQPIGRVLDVENVDVYIIEGGRIVSVKIFSADIEQENKFWGN